MLPGRVGVLGEISAHPLLKIARRRYFLIAMPRERIFYDLLDTRAARKQVVSRVELFFWRHNFRDAGLGQLALDEGDQLVRGHSVQFDAPALHEESALGVGRAIKLEPAADFVRVDAAKRYRLGFEIEFADIGQS